MDKNRNYLKWLQVEKDLRRKEIKLFSLEDFCSFFKVPSETAKKFLSRQVKRGILLRLKRGIYALGGDHPSDFLIANKIYQPSYISLETTLSFYQIIPESIYSITSVTTKPTREFTVLGKTFLYKSLKKDAFFGYRVAIVQGEEVFIASPEKALADYFYFLSREGRKINQRLELSKVSLVKVRGYLKKMGLKRQKIAKFL